MTFIANRESVEKHFDGIAPDYDFWKEKNSYYYSTIKAFISRIIPPGRSVLEVGCGTGEILATMKPKRGVGIDISKKMVDLASQKFPEYTFIHSPIEDLQLDEKFDYIIMVDVVDHVYDVVDVFKSLYRFCKPTTRIILTTINPWWDPVLLFMEKIGAKMPEGPHNFIEKGNLRRIFEMMDFVVSYSGFLLLFPKRIPWLSYLANSLGVRIWGVNRLSSAQYMIIQPTAKNENNLGLGCSVIIPCYNEQDNIEDAIRRIPLMGKETEIIVVNDGGTDNTVQKVKELQDKYPNLKLVDYTPNHGKGYAVRYGMARSKGDIIAFMDSGMDLHPNGLSMLLEQHR